MFVVACADPAKPDPETGGPRETAPGASEHSGRPESPVDTSPPDESPPDTTGDTPAETASDTDTDTAPDTADTGTTDDPGPDLRVAGPYAYAAGAGSYTTSDGCVVEYTTWLPLHGPTAPLVVLLHGLEGDRGDMEEQGAHFATWGLPAVTPTQCHASVLDLDQEQNALDAIELAAALGASEVLYAGHSAGGLAALVAAARDPAAVGYLGLDPVEWSGLAATWAPRVPVPSYGLLGDPSVCNLDQTARDIFALLPGGRLLGVTDADHCDFEYPIATLCAVACGSSANDRYSDDEIHAVVRGLGTAALLDLLSPGVTAAWWEAGGAWYEALGAAIYEP